MDTLSLSKLTEIVANDAAVRRRQRLQPVGGQGDKIFPPTYPGEGRNAPPRHVYEQRRIDGRDVWCVLVDSVQSQANRLEEGLLTAIRENAVDVPHVTVDFRTAALSGITELTSLDAPHRVYDAILRDSLLAGTPFMKSDLGQRLVTAKSDNASALLETSPTALLFGAWHSTGQGGGVGAKFARCLTSEIVAIDVPIDRPVQESRGVVAEPVTSGRRTGSRIDPLGILKDVQIYQSASDPQEWTPFEAEARKSKTGPVLFAGKKKTGKAGRASLINHGNIAPTIQPLGITCDHIEHVFVLSFAGLRRLHFGSEVRSTTARAMLAAVGLLALAEQDARGYSLRSRCELVCEGPAPLEVVHPDGFTETVVLNRAAARALYAEARRAAADSGFVFPAEPIRLTPHPNLVEIVRQSQELALSGEGGEEETEGGE
jgi:CRISPR-associated protein Csb1